MGELQADLALALSTHTGNDESLWSGVIIFSNRAPKSLLERSQDGFSANK